MYMYIYNKQTSDLEVVHVSINVFVRPCVRACMFEYVKLHIHSHTVAATFVITPNRRPMFHTMIGITTTTA